MTALLWFSAGAVTAGPFLGLILHLILADRVRARAYAVCQAQALITHGRSRVDEVNRDPGSGSRRRSPDVNGPFIDRQFSQTPSVIGDLSR